MLSAAALPSPAWAGSVALRRSWRAGTHKAAIPRRLRRDRKTTFVALATKSSHHHPLKMFVVNILPRLRSTVNSPLVCRDGLASPGHPGLVVRLSTTGSATASDPCRVLGCPCVKPAQQQSFPQAIGNPSWRWKNTWVASSTCTWVAWLRKPWPSSSNSRTSTGMPLLRRAAAMRSVC